MSGMSPPAKNDRKPTVFRITDENRGVGEEEVDAFTEFLDGTLTLGGRQLRQERLP